MSRRTRCGAALLLAAASILSPFTTLAGWSSAAAAAAATGTAAITATDRDFVIRVRLAGLWEIPGGRLAAKKGAAPRVREVGTLIADQHVALDRLVVAAARTLDITLPDEPNADQAFWLREMDAASGPAFDRVFVQRLREAHGRIFPAVAEVRARTQNAVVRKLADDANGFVKNHLTLLDSTGLVDYHSMTPLTEPAAEENRFVQLGDPRHPGGGTREQIAQGVVVVTGGLAALLALVLGMRLFFPSLGHRVVRPPDPVPSPHRRQ